MAVPLSILQRKNPFPACVYYQLNSNGITAKIEQTTNGYSFQIVEASKMNGCDLETGKVHGEYNFLTPQIILKTYEEVLSSIACWRKKI